MKNAAKVETDRRIAWAPSATEMTREGSEAASDSERRDPAQVVGGGVSGQKAPAQSGGAATMCNATARRHHHHH